MSIKLRAECVKGLINDFKSGRIINHQPNRSQKKIKLVL